MDTTAFFQALLNKRGLNPTSLARALKDADPSRALSQPTISRVLKGDMPMSKPASMAPIAELLGVKLAAFFDPDEAQAEADRLGLQQLQPFTDTTVRKYSDPMARVVEIQQFKTGGSMGRGLVLKDQPGVITQWRVTQEWIDKNVKTITASKNLCVVTGFGDSMRPLFNPGDPLLVDIGVTVVDSDSVYFFRVGDEGFVKRLQRIPGQGLRVLSANRDNYEPWTVTPDMDFQVLGRVLKVWRSEDF